MNLLRTILGTCIIIMCIVVCYILFKYNSTISHTIASVCRWLDIHVHYCACAYDCRCIHMHVYIYIQCTVLYMCVCVCCIPGRGRWWGHGHTLSHDLSSVESQCVWIDEPVTPGPERERERGKKGLNEQLGSEEETQERKRESKILCVHLQLQLT